MPLMRLFVASFILGRPCCHAFQMKSHRRGGRIDHGTRTDEMLTRIILDETEVESRGSHCIDGSLPEFYFKEGTYGDKFVFWLQGGGYCSSEQECVDMLPLDIWDDTVDVMPIQTHDTFANFSHVYIRNCDFGIFMGNRENPVEYGGMKLYFQGARILKHIVDTLAKNYTMTHVLLSGGSGGGHSIYAVADYFRGLLPDTIKKYRVAPINGWFINGQDDLKNLLTLQVMRDVISESCKAAYTELTWYKCLDPKVAYGYIKAPVFMTQIYDYTWEWMDGLNNFNVFFDDCINFETDGNHTVCNDTEVDILNEAMSNFTSALAEYSQYGSRGNGGFVSTCTKHVFYKEDNMFSVYANNGITVPEAISQWWDINNAAPTWYLPCKLGEGSGSRAQCEASCS